MKLKKDLLAIFVAVSMVASYASAYQVTRWQVNRSSNTATAETTVVIPKSNPGDILGSVIVNSCGAGSSILTIYDSSGTATGSLGAIDLTSSTITGGCLRQIEYFIPISSAITYTKTGLANITILWNNNRED